MTTGHCCFAGVRAAGHPQSSRGKGSCRWFLSSPESEKHSQPWGGAADAASCSLRWEMMVTFVDPDGRADEQELLPHTTKSLARATMLSAMAARSEPHRIVNIRIIRCF